MCNVTADDQCQCRAAVVHSRHPPFSKLTTFRQRNVSPWMSGCSFVKTDQNRTVHRRDHISECGSRVVTEDTQAARSSGPIMDDQVEKIIGEVDGKLRLVELSTRKPFETALVGSSGDTRKR